MDIFDAMFGGIFGQIMQELHRQLLLGAFIDSNPWMTAGEKDFTAYPQLGCSCKINAVGHPGCQDEELERGDFYGTVGMIRWNCQNPEMAIHKTCLEKDRL